MGYIHTSWIPEHWPCYSKASVENIFFGFLFWRTQISLRLGISEQTKKTELNSVHGKRFRNGLFEMAEPYLGSKYFFLQI